MANKCDLHCVAGSIQDAYMTALEGAQSRVGSLLQVSNIGTTSFVHVFNLGVGKEREWDGERVVRQARLGEIPGKTRKFENTLEVEVEDILSDTLGPYFTQAVDLGKKSATFPDRLVVQVLNEGKTSAQTNYDGMPLFSASHPMDDGTTQSNLKTSRPLSYANAQLSYTDFRAMKAVDGTALDLTPGYLIVPPALELTARSIAESEILLVGGQPTSNILRGAFEVVVLPGLTSTDWYFAAADSRPFVQHQFQAPELTALTDPDDHNVFWKDKMVFGWVARSEVMAGPYQLLQKNEAT